MELTPIEVQLNSTADSPTATYQTEQSKNHSRL
jgi:hypothetical protein